MRGKQLGIGLKDDIGGVTSMLVPLFMMKIDIGSVPSITVVCDDVGHYHFHRFD